MTVTELLITLDPWLHGRCRGLSWRFPGLDPDEVYQRVVLEFVENLERWLQQDATVGVVAQARTLMDYCLRHVETSELRGRRRRAEVFDEGDAGDGIEALTPPVPPTDDAAAAELLATLRGSTTPPCALCLLSLRLPAATERADAESAKAWKKGGANAVPRTLKDAWSMYCAGRERPELVGDDIGWKEHVGLAWYTDGPVVSVAEADRRAVAGKVERYANRGAEDLRAALMSRGTT